MGVDETLVLTAYRRLKDRKHGDLQLSVVNGALVKVWEVVKHDLRHMPLKETD